MKRLYVTGPELLAIQRATQGFAASEHPAIEAIKEVLGHEIAALCLDGVEFVAVSKLPENRFGGDA